MANTWLSDLVGTAGSFFRLGFSGPRLKSASGLSVRNANDTADAAVTASTLNATDDLITINSDATGTGSDWKFELARNSAATAHLRIVAPPAKGTDGHFLRQKAGTGSGILELELAAAAGGTNQIYTDTTTLNHGDSSPKAMFQLPANAIVHRVLVVVDTAFNGTTPSMSVGVNGGSASKYVASSHVDLKTADQYIVHPGHPANTVAEDLEITYAASGSTAGVARVIVEYSTPA